MKIRTEQRQFRATSQSGQHLLAMQPQAFSFFFFGGYEENVITSDGIAIVSISGPLEHHSSWFDSYDAITARIEEAMADDSVRAVVMCVDSPGGDASGVEEAHRKIVALKKEHAKPLCAYSNESCYSAAYWLACAADELWLPPTGGAGSVGVIAAAIDCTAANEKAGVKVELITTGARKADGHPDRPLTDDVIDVLQSRVDHLGKVFFASVGEARSMKPAAVQALQAGVFLGQDAVDAGLADTVAGWDEFMLTLRDTLSGVDAPGSGSVNAGGRSTSTHESVRTHARSESMTAKKTLALTKALNDAQSAVAAASAALKTAKTPEEKKDADAKFDAAVAALTEAKVKYSKRTRTDEVEEDDGDDDDDDDSKPDNDKPKPDEEEDDEDEDEDEDAEDDEDAEEEEESEEESKANTAKSLARLSHPKNGSARVEAMFRAVAKLTGKTRLSEQIGALGGLVKQVAQAKESASELEKLKSARRRDKVNALLDKAGADGRVTPASRDYYRKVGMRSFGELKGLLATLPKQVRTSDEPMVPRQNADGSAAAPAFDVASMSKEEREMYETSARALGMTLEKYMASAKDVAVKLSNVPRH